MTDPGESDVAGRGRSRALAAAALAAGKTVKQAADAAGCGERSVYRWMSRDPKFKARIERIRAQMVGQAIGKVSRQLEKNVERLSAIARSTNERAAVAAMRALLEHWKVMRESGELSDQVRELLARIGGAR